MEFTWKCDSGYVGRTTQRLRDRIKQHVPSNIRKKLLLKENSRLDLVGLETLLKQVILPSVNIF